MKIYGFNVVVISISLFILSSCCTKEFQICEGLDTVKRISFINFDKSELDSVYLVSYALNSNFQTKIDSIRIDSIIPTATINSFEGVLKNEIDGSNDYVLFVKDLNMGYQVSQFTIDYETCRQCGEKSYKYKFISSVKINNAIHRNLGIPPQLIIQK